MRVVELSWRIVEQLLHRSCEPLEYEQGSSGPADYAFTTLQPVLGTVEAPDGRQLVVADVPGLIEGASEGVGLGHEFLAHLERARMLVHVLDVSKPLEEQWRTIDAELTAYGAGLELLPQIVVLNKVDLVPERPVPSLRLPYNPRSASYLRENMRGFHQAS